MHAGLTRFYLISGLIVLTAILGAAIPLLSPLVIYSIMGAELFIIALIIIKFRASKSNDWIFIVGFIFPLIFAMILKITNQSLFGLWQVVLMILAPMGLMAFWKEMQKEILLKWFLIFFSAFLLIELISSITGRSRWDAALYQFVSDLKPLMWVLLGYKLCWDMKMERILNFTIKWYWLLAMFFVIFEWTAPGAYFALFSGVGGRPSEDTTSGLFPSRALGPFEHPSFLATTSAIFIIITVSRALILPVDKARNWFLVAMYFLLLVFSVQRQELVGCLVAVFLITLIANTKHLFLRLLLVLILGTVSGALFWDMFSQDLIQEASMWGLGTLTPIEHPRAQLFSGAWYVAHQYFPWGAGLGTYGGAGAEKFDHSLYLQLGFGNYWWYGNQDYLMDTYWPNSIGESGFFGALTLLMSYLFLIIYAMKRCVNEQLRARYYWAAAAASTAYILIISFSSPAFQDPRLFLLPAFLFGIASQVSKDQSKQKIVADADNHLKFQ